jgi:hypothetical protein
VARWQRGGKTAQFPDLEIEFVKWITDRICHAGGLCSFCCNCSSRWQVECNWCLISVADLRQTIIIFLSELNNEKLPFPKGVIVQVQEKGWFDDKIMRDWLQRV